VPSGSPVDRESRTKEKPDDPFAKDDLRTRFPGGAGDGHRCRLEASLTQAIARPHDRPGVPEHGTSRGGFACAPLCPPAAARPRPAPVPRSHHRPSAYPARGTGCRVSAFRPSVSPIRDSLPSPDVPMAVRGRCFSYERRR
jgi:hypothetical protein